MECCGPGYASPQDAILAPREKLLYTIAIYTGTGIQSLIISRRLMQIRKVDLLKSYSPAKYARNWR